MTKPACPRLFEAEALRDGRLAGAERLSFERHLESCSPCSREVAALRALGDRLRDPELDPETDELRVRRERTRLLAAFDAKLAPPERTTTARSWLIAAATASLLVAGVFVYFRARPTQAPFPTENRAVVYAERTASWSRRSEGDVEKILLKQGVLSIRVEHSPARRRLLVVLPDGELEDIGTRFTVSAHAGRTTHVSVQSGSVVLRLRGQAPLALAAGETWNPARPAVAATCSSCGPPAEAASANAVAALPRAALASPLASARSQRAPVVSPSAGSAATPSSSASEHEPDPSLDFRAAMTLLDSGDNAGAAARFANFLATHPRDARGEDAAYLRVIALQRLGNAGSMKEAAASYLRRYPKGFRHAEIEALAR